MLIAIAWNPSASWERSSPSVYGERMDAGMTTKMRKDSIPARPSSFSTPVFDTTMPTAR